jgi:glycine/D-amino acid oxidase-like deaminating enzyme
MRLRYGVSYWLDNVQEKKVRTYPVQHGNLTCDVVVVGAGFTGCATAYALASAGIDVVVLERSRVGRGSASASTALLMQETDYSFVGLRRRYGLARARAIWRLSADSVADLVALARGCNCDLQVPSSFHVATDAVAARCLRREYEARRAAGLPATWVGSKRLQRLSGASAVAAIACRGNAVVNPYRFTLSLAQAAGDLGARVLEHSPALHIAHDRRSVMVTTPSGRVVARHAIVATGFATPEFEPLMARFKMKTTYVIATSKIQERDRERMGRGRTMFWDTNQPYHYFRWTPEGRVLFGGMDRDVPTSGAARHAALAHAAHELKRTLETRFPQSGPFALEYAWDGLFATTPDGLPYIGPHRRYPRQLFALGYGGNGMTLGFLASQILVRHVLNRRRKTDALFRFDRFRRQRRS